MRFQQIIIREVHCPRCNAIAQERVRDRDDGFAIIYLWCDKCKLERNLGVTTRKALKLKRQRAKLSESANQTKSPLARSRLIRQIEILDRKIRQAEIGI